MERCYDKRTTKMSAAVWQIVKDENLKAGKYYFDLACMPNQDGNRLFNVELIIDTDGTWAYGAVAYDETYTLALTKEYINGAITIDIQIISKEKLEIMKELQNENFEVEDVFETASSNNLDEYIFSCGDLGTWKCSLLNTAQQITVTKEFVKLYKQIEDISPSVVHHLLTDPAAKTHHQNYVGGLTEHNFKFACYLYGRALAIYPNTNLIESVIRIAVCHDLCKVNLYKLGSDGKYYYDYEEYKHHAKESVRRAKILGIELSQLERVCVLLHMDGGFWDHEVEAELSDSDRELLCNNIRFISAVQWADMKACE